MRTGGLRMKESRAFMSDWLSREELAEELGIAPGTLAKWATERKGPPLVKIGRCVFYRRAAVRKWLAKRERKASHG